MHNTFSYCSELETVTIGEGVKAIGNSAFSYCSSLKNITIPSLVTSIDESISSCSGLETVTIGEGVETIGNNSFKSCSSLKCFYFYGETLPMFFQEFMQHLLQLWQHIKVKHGKFECF